MNTFYGPGRSYTMKLFLRRTLVRPVILFNNKTNIRMNKKTT